MGKDKNTTNGPELEHSSPQGDRKGNGARESEPQNTTDDEKFPSLKLEPKPYNRHHDTLIHADRSPDSSNKCPICRKPYHGPFCALGRHINEPLLREVSPAKRSDDNDASAVDTDDTGRDIDSVKPTKPDGSPIR